MRRFPRVIAFRDRRAVIIHLKVITALDIVKSEERVWE